MRPRWRRLAKAKAPAALKKPSGSGVPRGVPLVPFLATSWGMPRSSISHPPRVVRRTKERKRNLNNFPYPRAYSFAPRCAGFDVLSLSLNKERTKENQPKAAAFGNCSFAALHRERREVT